MGYHYYLNNRAIARAALCEELNSETVERMEAQALDTGVSNPLESDTAFYRVEHTADGMVLTVGQRVWYYVCPYTLHGVVTALDGGYCTVRLALTSNEIQCASPDVYPQTVSGARVLKERMAQNAITLTREIGDIATWILQHSERVELPLA